MILLVGIVPRTDSELRERVSAHEDGSPLKYADHRGANLIYTVDRARLISAIAYVGDKNEVSAPPQVVPSPSAQARQKLEAEARTIRQDKGYWDKSAPNFRALQARMGEIMRQLSGGVTARVNATVHVPIHPSTCPSPSAS